MISHRHRCVFVHIPKTGGTSIEDAIWEKPRRTEDLWMGFVSPTHNKYQTGGLQHLQARHIRTEVGEEIFRSYFKFAIVRNPWDKAVSQWRYLSQRRDLRDYLGVPANATLAHYLDTVAVSDHVQVMAQAEFVCDDDGQLMVDMLGRFETLEADARAIFARIGLPEAHLPHVTKSERAADYRIYYDAGTRERVAELYARDIELFGYRF